MEGERKKINCRVPLGVCCRGQGQPHVRYFPFISHGGTRCPAACSDSRRGYRHCEVSPGLRRVQVTTILCQLLLALVLGKGEAGVGGISWLP